MSFLRRGARNSSATPFAGLAKVFPGDARLADQVAMRALIREGVNRAHHYGIGGSRELLLFIYLFFEQGPDFESRPGQSWIKRILLAPNMDASEKMDVIYARLKLAQGRGSA